MAPTSWAAAALAEAAALICPFVGYLGAAAATPCEVPTMAATMAPTPTARRAVCIAEAMRVFVPACVLTTDSFIDQRVRFIEVMNRKPVRVKDRPFQRIA